MLAHRAQRSAIDRRSPGCADLGVPRVTLWVFSTDNLDLAAAHHRPLHLALAKTALPERRAID